MKWTIVKDPTAVSVETVSKDTVVRFPYRYFRDQMDLVEIICEMLCRKHNADVESMGGDD